MIKTEDLESKIKQLETTLSNENSLYIKTTKAGLTSCFFIFKHHVNYL